MINNCTLRFKNGLIHKQDATVVDDSKNDPIVI